MPEPSRPAEPAAVEETKERVAFLVEETQERLSCLLNPESLLVRRTAGLARQRALAGPATGRALSDDLLLFTGGGSTEMELDLLFDVHLAGSSIRGAAHPVSDVRDLTGPLWRLAENGPEPGGAGYGRPPLVRFLWGKAWNVPAIVAAVAERHENFSPGGIPTRSWIRLRLLRVAEEARPSAPPALPPGIVAVPTPDSVPDDRLQFYPVMGGAAATAPGAEPEPAVGERLDQIAARVYGDPRLWSVIAAFNGLDDPLHLPPGLVLRIPDRSLLVGLPPGGPA